MMNGDERIAFLRALFDRYLALPRHQGGAEFAARLQALQQWEREDIRRRHTSACIDNQHYATVVEYYLQALHSGLSLQGMIDRGPDAVENARKLNKAYQLFANAIEFSVVSADIEDQMVQALADQPITPGNYAEALRACDNLPQREARLQLLIDIGHEIAPHIGSRIIHTGFKMLKGIFHHSGMGEIHSTLNQGFTELRKVPRLAQILAEFADCERKQLQSLVNRQG